MKIMSLDDFSLDKLSLDRFKLDNFSIDGPSFSTTYDRSTPVQVVNAAYDTSGNGGRKLVRLSNGWLVCAVTDTGASPGQTVRLYVSDDNGATWSELCYVQQGTAVAVGSPSLCCNGTTIYLITNTGTAFIFGYVINALTQTDVNIYANRITIDTGQSSVATTSIAIDSSGNLHAAWCSKNATYPNSFNIRYSTSTDGGATWAAVTQVTTANIAGVDFKNPCIVLKSNGYPSIFADYKDSGNCAIGAWNFNGSVWSAMVNIYVVASATYVQSNPSADVDSTGRIWVVWHGLDSTDTSYYNIRAKYSDDNGTTWSNGGASNEKVTSGNTIHRQYASIARDENNDVHVVYNKNNGTASITKIKRTSGTWGSESNIYDDAGAYPSVCANHRNFTQPMTIYMDITNSDVKFYGVFTVDG